MDHDEAGRRIAIACDQHVAHATAARLAINVCRRCGISAAVALQVTAAQLANDMEEHAARPGRPGRPGRHAMRRVVRALRDLVDAPSDALPPEGGEMRPALRALA